MYIDPLIINGFLRIESSNIRNMETLSTRLTIPSQWQCENKNAIHKQQVEPDIGKARRPLN